MEDSNDFNDSRIVRAIVDYMNGLLYALSPINYSRVAHMKTAKTA
jgi:hypothetical protein